VTASITVVGGGWAGLAAAIRLTERGHRVTLNEASPTLGGRARSVNHRGMTLDNGQHILIGAYARTLQLMREVGVDPKAVLSRQPLVLRTPDGHGLSLPLAATVTDLFLGITRTVSWPWPARLSLLWTASRWAARRFRCPAGQTVEQLCSGLHPAAFEGLIDPLCVAALNTPPSQACGQTFLRVLRDALLGPPGSADLLLPRAPLGALLPDAASHWLQQHGTSVHVRRPVTQLAPLESGWVIDGEAADAVVLACGPTQTARLAATLNPAWAQTSGAMAFEPIATVVISSSARVPLGSAMVMLPDGPAQFAFDLAAFGHPAGDHHRHTFVVSAAAPWIAEGTQGLLEAVMAQARRQFPALAQDRDLQVLSCIVEKQATFRCTPQLRRPSMAVAPGLWAAGDHIEGPYPATLEGAVRSGEAAAEAVHQALSARCQG
jgi:squalene-associated FAD-dependent desaturase